MTVKGRYKHKHIFLYFYGFILVKLAPASVLEKCPLSTPKLVAKTPVVQTSKTKSWILRAVSYHELATTEAKSDNQATTNEANEMVAKVTAWAVTKVHQYQ